jgi:hypothetical protein
VGFPFANENRDSLSRLEVLFKSLSDHDFGKKTSFGWTVSAVIAHLAYWDQRMLIILRRWQERGLDASPVDADAVNDAMRPLCEAIEPRKAVQLCLASAAELNAAFEALSSEEYEHIRSHAEQTGTQFRMNRSLHRDDHLAHLQAALVAA